MQHRTKLKLRHIRTYNAFLHNCAESAVSEAFARMYDRHKIHLPRRVVQNGHPVLKG